LPCPGRYSMCLLLTKHSSTGLQAEFSICGRTGSHVPHGREWHNAGKRQSLIDDAKCYGFIRHLKLAKVSVVLSVTRKVEVGFVETVLAVTLPVWDCQVRLITGRFCTGHHQPLRVWIVHTVSDELNLSNHQSATGFGLNKDVNTIAVMTDKLQEGLSKISPRYCPRCRVECDETLHLVTAGTTRDRAKKKGRGPLRQLKMTGRTLAKALNLGILRIQRGGWDGSPMLSQRKQSWPSLFKNRLRTALCLHGQIQDLRSQRSVGQHKCVSCQRKYARWRWNHRSSRQQHNRRFHQSLPFHSSKTSSEDFSNKATAGSWHGVSSRQCSESGSKVHLSALMMSSHLIPGIL